MIINCIIVDDEPASQTVLKNFISNIDFLDLKATCHNAIEALEAINESHNIDLIFLDINMPKISGITFYKSLQNPPDVIFTTAYPQYAVNGFEVNAIDYLLKPFSFERFFIAINKVLEKKSSMMTKPNQEHFILIKSNKTLYKIISENILFIEAFGDYVKVYYIDDTCILTNATFSSILESLPKHLFIRCHKSFAINFNKMSSVYGNLISLNNHKIPIGQKYKAEFMKAINTNNLP